MPEICILLLTAKQIPSQSITAKRVILFFKRKSIFHAIAVSKHGNVASSMLLYESHAINSRVCG